MTRLPRPQGQITSGGIPGEKSQDKTLINARKERYFREDSDTKVQRGVSWVFRWEKELIKSYHASPTNADKST